MQRQILGDIEAILSIYLCDYGKKLIKQQTFLVLTEDWKKILDKNCFRGVVLIYLSKKLAQLIMNFRLQSFMPVILTVEVSRFFVVLLK